LQVEVLIITIKDGEGGDGDPSSGACNLLQEKMVQRRRYLHQHPELSFQEHDTSRWVSERLEELGVSVIEGVGNGDKGAVYPHHHPRFDIDEDALSVGLEALLATYLQYTATS
jgi:metal-dependent amidase/aminoacylase/carboxypeptidase family protein